MARIHRLLPHGEEGNKPKRIVIHAMAERIIDPEPVDAVDYLDRLEYSAHSLIYPDGTNCRCRNDNQVAWHARGFNTDSLGIEFLVPGDHDYASFLEAIKHHYVSPEAYAAGLYQVREWMRLHAITSIDLHSKLSPGRKVDPGAGFPLADFIHDLGM